MIDLGSLAKYECCEIWSGRNREHGVEDELDDVLERLLSKAHGIDALGSFSTSSYPTICTTPV